MLDPLSPFLKKEKAIGTTEMLSATVMDSTSSLIDAWMSYKQCSAQEKTKRTQIEAQRDIALKQIEKQTEIIKQYLTCKFKEREQSILEMFNTLDKGIISKNSDLINKSMDAIVSTLHSSPLNDIATIMQKINDPTVDSIEI